ADRARLSGGGRPADARRHHGGRDQHSLPHRQQPVGRRGAGADPRDEEDHRDRWGGRHPTARSPPQRQMAGAGDRAGGPRQRSTKGREAGAVLPQITGGTRPGGGTGKTLRPGGRRRRQAGARDPAAGGAGGAASGAGKHGAARAAGDAPDQCARLRRRHPCREQDCQPVRAVHRSYSEKPAPAKAGGKAGKPTEFGKMVKLQEAENQIVVAYEVYDRRPSDSDLLLAAIETHQATLGCTPHLVAADAGFYSAKNEAAAKAKGVKRVCIPNRSTKSPERKREQKKRWFRNGQKWRTGCEGRISVVKRRHGLGRSRYKGDAGIKRWVGLGVIADNLVNISRVMAKQPNRSSQSQSHSLHTLSAATCPRGRAPSFGAPSSGNGFL